MRVNQGKEVGTLDLVTWDRDTGSVVRAGGLFSPTDTEFRMSGLLSDPSDGGSLPITLTVPFGDPTGIDTAVATDAQGRHELVIREDGERISNYRVEDYTSVPGIGGSVTIHSGVWRSGDRRTDFVAVEDPIPVLVLLAGIGVAGCLAAIGISALASHTLVLAQIEACRSLGYSSKISVDVAYGFKRKPLRIACHYKANADCVNVTGRVEESHVLELADLT